MARTGVSLRPVEADETGNARPGSPWRLRFRDPATGRQREKRFHHEQGSRSRQPPPSATKAHAAAIEAMQEGRSPDEVLTVQPPGRLATFDECAVAFIRARAAYGLAASTLERYSGHLNRFQAIVRGLEGIPEGQAIPADVLSRQTIHKVTLALRAEGRATTTIANIIQCALDVWAHASDDDLPGVPPAPRSKSGLIPRRDARRPLPAPKQAELDAVLRELPRNAHVTLGAAIMMKATGLRVDQCLSARRSDFREATGTLYVRTGKSHAEKAGRFVPVAPWLFDELAPYMNPASEPDAPLIRRRVNEVKMQRNDQWRVLRKAADRAAEKGLIRVETYRPPPETGRRNARGAHMFRAAFMYALEEAGHRDDVINRLVGHRSGSTRHRHYVDESALWGLMQAAVAEIPAPEWQGPVQADQVPEAAAGGGSNVLRFGR